MHSLQEITYSLKASLTFSPLGRWLDAEREMDLNLLFTISGLQDSFRFRGLHRARSLAFHLIDDKGELKIELLEQILKSLEIEGYFFYPEGTSDAMLTEHIVRTLRAFRDPKLVKALKRFQKPLCHKWAEQIVSDTLGVDALTDAHVRQAVLCACLTPLRQNVGSCFATAPAILIQRNQLDLFLEDLYQLLSTGKLKRVFGGIEYALPLSPSTGIGDLRKDLVSFSSAFLSPGLLNCFENMGWIDASLDIEKKIERVREIITPLVRSKSSLTVEECLQHLLLTEFSLTEEDLSHLHEWESAELKGAKLLSNVSLGTTSKKLDRLQKFVSKHKRARAAFKSVCDNPLLKAWEFTLASFSEVKMEFSRWNLYLGLGLGSDQVGGIGELLYQRIDEKIREVNEKIDQFQRDYEVAFDQVRATESLLRNVSSEADARRLKAELQTRVYHMRSCLELRDKIHTQGSHYSTLLQFLLQKYDEKFPEYFQEIYDAEMQDFKGSLYDDSPAGFRLVYKHGRTDPSLWTLIYDEKQYIDCLVDFFIATEGAIVSAAQWEGGEKEILEITSDIVSHVRTERFLQTALKRTAKESADKKPWAYVSGGTMTTLLKTYYYRQGELRIEGRWVESESDLLIFLADTLKNLPPLMTNGRKELLMTSPTHACILLPELKRFKEGWQESGFTYTWVRDQVFLPNQKFYAQMRLSPEEQAFLLEELHKIVSHSFQPSRESYSVVEWRNSLVHSKKELTDFIDAFLYQSLPVVPSKDAKFLVKRILADVMNDKLLSVIDRNAELDSPYMTAQSLRNVAKGCYLLSEEKLFSPFDLHHFVAEHARFLGVGQPTPLLFADTNWGSNYFGFVVNPGTQNLELWRLDRTAESGMPMSDWRQWVNGTSKEIWAIYPQV